MTAWDPDGPGPLLPALIATGNFYLNGQAPLLFVGSWDGIAWSSMGPGLTAGSGICLTQIDPDGNGPLLSRPVVGGAGASTGGQPVDTPSLWTGQQWQTVGGGVGGSPFPDLLAIASYSNQLFIGGFFESAGGVPAHRCARWDGSSWHETDPRWGDSAYYAMHTHKGQLYVGGSFGLNSQPPYYGVMKWSGSQWDPMIGSPAFNVYALGSYKGRIIAGGFFFTEPGQSQPGEWIAQWNGTSWGPLGTGMNAAVNALTTFDPDGPGPMPELLIAGGLFTTAGGVPANRIAAWDGTQWTALGSGINGEVNALCVFQNQLYIGGYFTVAGGQASPYLARWGCPAPPPPACYANCDGSTRTPVLTANDFMCFINTFANRDPAANCDGSTTNPTLTANDFMCFINTFAAGCP